MAPSNRRRNAAVKQREAASGNPSIRSIPRRTLVPKEHRGQFFPTGSISIFPGLRKRGKKIRGAFQAECARQGLRRPPEASSSFVCLLVYLLVCCVGAVERRHTVRGARTPMEQSRSGETWRVAPTPPNNVNKAVSGIGRNAETTNVGNGGGRPARRVHAPARLFGPPADRMGKKREASAILSATLSFGQAASEARVL